MAADISNFEFLSWKDFFAGWISGVCSITVGYPLETIKVRQQMTANSRSASHHAIHMLKNEGIRCFFRGLSYPVMTTGVTNSLYFGFYANSLRMMENSRDEKHFRNCCDYGSIYPGWHRDCFLAGCIGGAASTLINIPVELAKTVSQAHARDTAAGQKYANESTVLRNIFRSQGVRGCFRGANILILRDVPIFGLYAICYEHINCLLKPKNCVDWFTRTLCEGLAGGCAGVITWFVAMPCDVVKSRYTSDCYSKTPQYSSTLDCVSKTYQQHGWRAFFKECAAERSADPVENKVRQLKAESAGNIVLKLNNTEFREYIEWPSKNYSFVVLFAAMASHRNCSPCALVHDEFELTAKSFRVTHGGVSDRLFFGVVDYDQNAEIFRGANVSNVPSIVYFPAKLTLQMTTDVFDIRLHGYLAESLIEKSRIEFQVVRRPLDFGAIGLLVLFSLGSLGLHSRCGILHSRTLWSIIVTTFCLLGTSGQIWNYLRSPPFLTWALHDGFRYMHPSSKDQFVAETYVVFLLNAGITANIIIYIEYSSTMEINSAANRIFRLVCVGLNAMLIFTLELLSYVKTANHPCKGTSFSIPSPY